MTAAQLAKKLGGRRSGRGWFARCPGHDDRTPSLRIDPGRDGRVLLFCHGQHCHDDLHELCDSAGIRMSDLFPEGHRLNPRPGWFGRLNAREREALARLETLAHDIRRIERRWERELEAAWGVIAPELRHLGADGRAELFAWIEELHRG